MDNYEILEKLFKVYEQPMYRICYSILGNVHQAEDAVGDAFERLVRYLPECAGITDDRTKRLVVRVTKSAAVDIYRKNKKEKNIVSMEDYLLVAEEKEIYLTEEYFVESNTLTLRNTCDVEIMDITLVDNISSLDMNNFYCEEDVLADTDATGMLIDERIPMDTRDAEFADKKLLLATMELTNTTNRDLIKWEVNSYIDFRYFEQEGIVKKPVNRVGTYAALGFGEWCYLEGSDYIYNEEDRIHSFMCVDIPEGESKIITMGIVVFEDELDSLYLGVSPYGFEELKEGQIEGRQYVKIMDLLK